MCVFWLIWDYLAANKQISHFFSQLTDKIEELSKTDFQNKMLFPGWVHKLMIILRQNSYFFLKCIIFPAIDCINSQLFHRKMAKFMLFAQLVSKIPNIFLQLIVKILDHYASHNSEICAFYFFFYFSQLVSKTHDTFFKWLCKFGIISKQKRQTSIFLYNLFSKCKIYFMIDCTN